MKQQMGKASKWIRNFLMGRKEEKQKTQILSVDLPVTTTAIIPSSPIVKRRWSFGRSTGNATSHRVSKSMDSVDGTRLRTQLTKQNKHKAATKIQAIYRSYLAKKALRALRGLVRIQALVRGHLVRKQTAATLKGMHALISIQVRARVQRIQMAEEEARCVVKRQSSVHRHLAASNGYRKETVEKGRRSDYSIRSHHNFKFYSGELPSLRHEHDPINQNMPQNSPVPEHFSTITKSNSTTAGPGHVECSHGYSDQPSYMSNTTSSRAKTRSQSEPKRRPNLGSRQKSRRTVSIEEVNIRARKSPSGSEIDNEPWLIKLYKSRMSADDHESNSITTSTSNSTCSKYLDHQYEPHVTLF